MSNCKACASLCCIAPSIRGPDDHQGRVEGDLVKSINVRCDKLLTNGQCSTYENRGYKYKACIYYDCKGFGPPLTEYLTENELIHADGTLKKEGFDLFCLLNQLMIRTFHGSKDSELQETLLYYDNNKTWPNWLTDKAYQDYIYGRRFFQKNPRLTIIESGETQESSPARQTIFRRIITIFQVNK